MKPPPVLDDDTGAIQPCRIATVTQLPASNEMRSPLSLPPHRKYQLQHKKSPHNKPLSHNQTAVEGGNVIDGGTVVKDGECSRHHPATTRTAAYTSKVIKKDVRQPKASGSAIGGSRSINRVSGRRRSRTNSDRSRRTATRSTSHTCRRCAANTERLMSPLDGVCVPLAEPKTGSKMPTKLSRAATPALV